MTALHTLKKVPFSIDLLRDECPVIFRNPGDPAEFKKHFKAVRTMLRGKPLSADPAIELKKTRNKRGLV